MGLNNFLLGLGFCNKDPIPNQIELYELYALQQTENFPTDTKLNFKIPFATHQVYLFKPKRKKLNSCPL